MNYVKLLSFLAFVYSCHFQQIQGVEFNFYDEARLSSRYYAGDFINIKSNMELEAFLPCFVFDESLAFIDIDAYKFSSSNKWGANIGTGFRTDSDIGVIGINAFSDYCRIRSKVNFHRIGIGAELLNQCWDLRINGYLPVGAKEKSSKFCEFDNLGDFFFLLQKIGWNSCMEALMSKWESPY